MTETGFCRNPRCSKAADGEPVERYPGPGEFCPECGERLQARIPAGVAAGAETFAVQSRIAEALLPSEDDAAARGPWFTAKRAVAAFGLVVAVAAAGLLGTRAGERTAAVRVCSSSVSERVARDVVRAYEAKRTVHVPRLDLRAAGSDPCDVRFWANADGKKETVVGYDAIVVVVHPQNPVTRLNVDQVRGVFAGRIRDWSQLGRRSGPVTAYVPNDASDELQRLSATLMRGAAIGGRVVRLGSSADVVRRVASAGGADAVGIVAFGEAVPAKVVALGSGVPPSVVSIGSHRYPLFVDVMVASDLRAPPATAVALIDFAHSAEAQSIVARSGLVPKEGT